MIIILSIVAISLIRVGLRTVTSSLKSLAVETDRIAQGQLGHALEMEGGDEKLIEQVQNDLGLLDCCHITKGYASLMDRKGHIREKELARVFNFDQAMSRNLESFKEAIKQTNNLSVTDDWPKVLAEAKRIKGLLQDFENKWLDQKKIEPLIY